jgi:hypothetical protein
MSSLDDILAEYDGQKRDEMSGYIKRLQKRFPRLVGYRWIDNLRGLSKGSVVMYTDGDGTRCTGGIFTRAIDKKNGCIGHIQLRGGARVWKVPVNNYVFWVRMSRNERLLETVGASGADLVDSEKEMKGGVKGTNSMEEELEQLERKAIKDEKKRRRQLEKLSTRDLLGLLGQKGI